MTAPSRAAAAERNNGSDPTRPRTEVETLYRFENQPGRPPDSQNTWLVRGQGRMAFDEHWSGALRLDVPLVLTNAQPSERFVFGTGNVLTQLALIYTVDEYWALAAGTQLTFPTASADATGSSAYSVLPGLVVRRMLPELSDGSFFAPEILYAIDYGPGAGPDPGRDLQIQPTLDIELPRGFFLNLWPSPDIRVDLAGSGRGRLFFPFDVLAGVMLTPKLVALLEVSVPMVKDYPVYDFKMEARIRVFFD